VINMRIATNGVMPQPWVCYNIWPWTPVLTLRSP
jgi:hypothetical protein